MGSPFAHAACEQPPEEVAALLEGAARPPLTAERAKSGLPVDELFGLTDDPGVRLRLARFHGGRISRREVVRALQDEAAATWRLRLTLRAGAVLAAFCLLMLAANAALTFHVVRLAGDTALGTGGKLTDRSGSMVVGTASSAELVDLSFAHHAPAEAAAALLSLRHLLVRSDAGAAAAYQVLSASLQPGSSLEFVVAAAAPASADASVGTPAGGVGQLAPAELARIVISDHGVHEVRSGAPSGADAATAAGGAAAAPSPRRLLTVGGGLGEIKGVVFDVATGACSVAGPGGVPGTCTSAANLIGCPLKPTCGANGKLYGGPCEARAAGTTPVCVGCKPSDCPGGTGTLPFDASGGRPAPGGTGAGVQQARRRVWTAVAASTALGQPDKAGAAAAQGKPNRRRAA